MATSGFGREDKEEGRRTYSNISMQFCRCVVTRRKPYQEVEKSSSEGKNPAWVCVRSVGAVAGLEYPVLSGPQA